MRAATIALLLLLVGLLSIVTPSSAALSAERVLPPTREEIPDASFVGPPHNAAIGLGGGTGSARRLRGGCGGRRFTAAWEAAVERGLDRLAERPSDEVDGCALATLAFLGAGYTDRGTIDENRFAGPVRDGLRRLVGSQDSDGRFGETIRAHALATFAITEAYWMTRNPRYRPPARMGLDYLLRSRNSGGSWGGTPADERHDVFATGWAVLALKSAERANLEIETAANDSVLGAITAHPPSDSGEAAAILLSRRLLGEETGSGPWFDAITPEGTAGVPEARYFATHALFQVGGAAWARWNAAVVKPLAVQRMPESTEDVALRTLCLEVFGRTN